MLNSGKYFDTIIENITILRREIESKAALGFTDLNKYCEDFVKEILNRVYGYELKNLNQKSSSFPGLDLGDKTAGIAFQITSTRTSEKVDATLLQCLDKKHYQTFQKINVFVLTSKQTSYTIRTVTAPHFSFDWKVNVLDFDDVYADIAALDVDRRKQLRDYIQKELPHFQKRINSSAGNGWAQIGQIVKVLAPLALTLSVFAAMNYPSWLTSRCNEPLDRIIILTSKFSPGPQDDFGVSLRSQLAMDIDVDSINTDSLNRYLTLTGTTFRDSLKSIFKEKCRSRGLLIFGNYSLESKRVDCGIFVNLEDVAKRNGALVYVKNPDSVKFVIDNQVEIISKFVIALLLGRSDQSLDRSEKLLREVLKLNTSKANKHFIAYIHLYLGNVAFRKRQYYDAKKEFAYGLNQGVDNAFLEYNMGATFLALHQRDSASKAFERAARLNPKLKVSPELLAFETWIAGEDMFIFQDSNKLFGLMDLEGRILLKPSYTDISPFKNGLARFEDRKDRALVGFLDKKGRVKIPAKFKDATSFDGGVSVVTNLDNKYGVIDTTGRTVVSFDYDQIASLKNGELFLAAKGDHMGVINRNNEVVEPFKYIYTVADSGFETLSHSHRITFSAISYDYDFDDAYLLSVNESQRGGNSKSIDKKWGLVDIKTGYVTECKYDRLIDAGYPYVEAFLNNQIALITAQGDIVVDFGSGFTSFQSLGTPGNKMIVAWKGNHTQLLRLANGKVAETMPISADSCHYIRYAGAGRLCGQTSDGAILFDLTGKRIAKTDCENFLSFDDEGKSTCEVRGLAHVIDVNGNMISQ
ncbi:SMEK domain-containing protein [Chryseolinea soli]|uniref:WG repeat-containing protein n=1 Tax=Chryseolinea soli TaxID=2321403 RepID=A0A385SLR7_9BACT|nr:SMEK domain-containing protein [Chryseolinea soli]AYB31904.1 WG repeat-containing protein [Chryseolinea soli]